MANKIPPHIARELRRHVMKSPPPSTSKTSQSPFFSFNPSNLLSFGKSSTFSTLKVLGGCLALTATMTAVPYFFMHTIRPLNEREEALTGSQIRRGAFNNSGSKDVGKDPYWDFKRGRRKRLGEDGCEDDGGYVDLFARDDPGKVELGDEYRRR